MSALRVPVGVGPCARVGLAPGLRVGLAGIAALLACAGCGFKGPLYLPERNATVITRPAQAAPSTPGQTQTPAPKSKGKAPSPQNPASPPSPQNPPSPPPQ